MDKLIENNFFFSGFVSTPHVGRHNLINVRPVCANYWAPPHRSLSRVASHRRCEKDWTIYLSVYNTIVCRVCAIGYLTARRLNELARTKCTFLYRFIYMRKRVEPFTHKPPSPTPNTTTTTTVVHKVFFKLCT